MKAIKRIVEKIKQLDVEIEYEIWKAMRRFTLTTLGEAMTGEEIIQAFERLDMTLRPLAVFGHPDDIKAIKEAMPDIEKKFDLRPTECLEKGMLFTVNREEMDIFKTLEVEFEPPIEPCRERTPMPETYGWKGGKR